MLAAQTQSIGTFKGPISGPSARSGAFAETLAPNYNPFGSSLAPTHGAIHSAFGAASPSAETLQCKEPLHALGTPHSSAHVLHAAQDAPAFGIATPVTQWGVGMLHFEYT
ncbi:hypothetical protein ATANTOWER_032903, partial [Ataeniobius toweri]|nr:hypothetical protein [Ataeniobius toweri]